MINHLSVKPLSQNSIYLTKVASNKLIPDLVITNSIKDGAPEYNYYLKNKHWDNTLWDLQYKDVMKNLSIFQY